MSSKDFSEYKDDWLMSIIDLLGRNLKVSIFFLES